MQIKKIIFNLFRKIGQLISGKGFARLPFAVPVYQFFYKQLKPKGIVEVHAAGHTILINSKDTGLAPPLIMHGIFSPAETEVIRSILKPSMVFVDIGANIGYFSLIAARVVGEKGMVYAFEPDNEHFQLLQKNIKKNGYTNITSVKKAVSDTTGVASFYLKKDNLCAHSLIPNEKDSVVEVETITLDEYFKTNNNIDVIKIDVEGAEPAVFRGMQKVISINKKIALITEFYPNALKRCGVSPETYLQSIIDSGFILYRIDEEKQKRPSLIDVKMIPALSRGEGIQKLINILCLKNWDLPHT